MIEALFSIALIIIVFWTLDWVVQSGSLFIWIFWAACIAGAAWLLIG